jgi:hypothetical protein
MELAGPVGGDPGASSQGGHLLIVLPGGEHRAQRVPRLAGVATVPPERYAQTAATAASLKTGAYALGAAAAGLLAGLLNARELVLLVGIGQVAALAPFLGRRARGGAGC